MPSKELVEKKTVTIQNVLVEDWELLREIAETMGLSMNEMIHLFAYRFRFGSDDTMEMVDRLREMKKDREEAMKGVVTGKPIPFEFVKPELAKDKNGKPILSQPTSVSTLGTYMSVYSVFRKCPTCGRTIDPEGVCPSCQLIPPEY